MFRKRELIDIKIMRDIVEILNQNEWDLIRFSVVNTDFGSESILILQVVPEWTQLLDQFYWDLIKFHKVNKGFISNLFEIS